MRSLPPTLGPHYPANQPSLPQQVITASNVTSEKNSYAHTSKYLQNLTPLLPKQQHSTHTVVYLAFYLKFLKQQSISTSKGLHFLTIISPCLIELPLFPFFALMARCQGRAAHLSILVGPRSRPAGWRDSIWINRYWQVTLPRGCPLYGLSSVREC